jgi:hypothetical protein
MLQIDPRVSISCSARSLVRLHRWMCPLLAKRASIEIIFCIPCCSVMLFLYWQYDHWYRNSTIYSPPNKANGNGPILSTSEMIRVKKLRTKKSGAFAATGRNRNWWPKVCNFWVHMDEELVAPPPSLFFACIYGMLATFCHSTQVFDWKRRKLKRIRPVQRHS